VGGVYVVCVGGVYRWYVWVVRVGGMYVVCIGGMRGWCVCGMCRWYV